MAEDTKKLTKFLKRTVGVAPALGIAAFDASENRMTGGTKDAETGEVTIEREKDVPFTERVKRFKKRFRKEVGLD